MVHFPQPQGGALGEIGLARPFRASTVLYGLEPRAMPWAGLVPQLSSCSARDCIWLWLARFAQPFSPMGWNEKRTAFLFKRFPSVGPVERMCHCRVVVGNELPDLSLQIVDRLEVSTTQTFALNDAENDLNLIEPGTMFW